MDAKRRPQQTLPAVENMLREDELASFTRNMHPDIFEVSPHYPI
jgi:hypothetical protein